MTSSHFAFRPPYRLGATGGIPSIDFYKKKAAIVNLQARSSYKYGLPVKNPIPKTVQNPYFFLSKSGVVLKSPPFFRRYETSVIVMFRTRLAF